MGLHQYHYLVYIISCLYLTVYSRRHNVQVRDDDRKMIACTTFGFLQHSYLSVELTDFTLPPTQTDAYTFGFTLEKSGTAGLTTFLDSKRDKCAVRDELSDLNPTSKSSSDSTSLTEKKPIQVSLVLLRFNIRDYKAGEIFLSTRGLPDMNQLSLFPITDKDYSNWISDPLNVPPSFHLEKPESRYRVYTDLWDRFFDKFMPYLLLIYRDEAGGKSSHDNQVCPNQLLERALNSSLGEFFSLVLSDFKAASTAASSYEPAVRIVGASNSSNSNSTSAKLKSNSAESVTSATPEDSLEDFAEWFLRVIDLLRKQLKDKKSVPSRAYTLNGAVVSAHELKQLLDCVFAATEKDQHVTLSAYGGPLSTEYHEAIVKNFGVLASNGSLPLVYNPDNKSFSANFVAAIERLEEEGYYNMYFHNCPPRESTTYSHSTARISFKLHVVERNQATFLSATEYALPLLNFVFAGLYVVLTVVWIVVLVRAHSRGVVYKIHYLMLLLLILKTLAFLFHGINYYVIGRTGHPEEAWAVMYYITHLVKGALLFMTVALIGAGWAFVKHVLSDRDKKILLIVIPLQILANVAKIIIEESEESMQSYYFFKQLLTLLDLICCGAILFPIVWSIRHLQQAAQTDGKAAQSLEKLRLFQHFYILIVCYIYFTRIMASLIRITVSFKLVWMDDLFGEATTLVFFLVSGYKFRPASNNPYLAVPVDDLEMDEVAVTPNGALENVQQTSRGKSRRAARDREADNKRRSADEAERKLIAQVRLDADYDAEDDDVVWDTRVMYETSVTNNKKTRLLDAAEYE